MLRCISISISISIGISISISNSIGWLRRTARGVADRRRVAPCAPAALVRVASPVRRAGVQGTSAPKGPVAGGAERAARWRGDGGGASGGHTLHGPGAVSVC